MLKRLGKNEKLQKRKKCDIMIILEVIAMENKEMVGKGVNFERIRRITGYLVGTVERFNDGKKAEEHDRVKHTFQED